MQFEQYIRVIPDFPKPGIQFLDITPLLKNAAAFASLIEKLAQSFSQNKVDKIIGIEARGFILGAAVAYHMKVGFVPVRKAGKLPHTVLKQEYVLEYGSSCMEMHKDALVPEDKVLLIDDVIATGGTIEATINLVQKAGGQIIGCGTIIDLDYLPGLGLLKQQHPRIPFVSVCRASSILPE